MIVFSLNYICSEMIIVLEYCLYNEMMIVFGILMNSGTIIVFEIVYIQRNEYCF